MTRETQGATGSETTPTSAQFHILLTLADGQRHGYGIMQEIERRTDGALVLGPGTLYRSIKQLLARGLIVEVDGSPESPKQRRIYTLTRIGEVQTAEEARRLRELVRWAEKTMVLQGGRP
jgi:DNA-binding PadR family transcriptional regulator